MSATNLGLEVHPTDKNHVQRTVVRDANEDSWKETAKTD